MSMNVDQEREELPGGEGAGDEKQAPVGEKPLEVDLSDDGDDEGESAAAAPLDRKGRRRQFRELRESVNAEKERNTRLERELAELRGTVQGIRQAPTAAPQREEADPVDAEMDGIERQQDALVAQMRADGISEEKFEKLRNEHRKLGRKLYALAAKQMNRDQGPQFDRTEYENQQLQAEFPDVWGDPVRLQEAKTELMKLRRAGKPLNIVTAREAASIVSKRYTRTPSAPSAADRARHTSVPSRPGATGGTSGRWVPTKLELNTARAFTSHIEDISDEERLKIWAKKVGKKHGMVG